MTDFAGENLKRRVLIIAYYFPPFFSVGASIRIVKFLKYLPRLGWQPIVLTIDDQRAYDHLGSGGSEDLCADIPPQAVICRSGAGDLPEGLLKQGRAARERSRAARYVVNGLRFLRRWAEHWLMIPDERITWLPTAVREGRRLIRQYQPEVILVTCPPHSASVIGAVLHWITGVPLVLDFRDDWVDTPWFEQKPLPVRLLSRWLEALVIRSSERVILVTPASCETYAARYPNQNKFAYLSNGVDLEDFPPVADSPAPDGLFRIVHAGMLTESADWRRSPESLFLALAEVRRSAPELFERMRVVFTDPLPASYRQVLERLDLSASVEETGHLRHPDVFAAELRKAGLLLAINFEGFSAMVPGKLYEYWAIGGAPILVLGYSRAAQKLVEQHQLGKLLALDDVQGIANALMYYCREFAANKPVRISRAGVQSYDRAVLTAALVQELESVASVHSKRGAV